MEKHKGAFSLRNGGLETAAKFRLCLQQGQEVASLEPSHQSILFLTRSSFVYLLYTELRAVFPALLAFAVEVKNDGSGKRARF